MYRRGLISEQIFRDIERKSACHAAGIKKAAAFNDFLYFVVKGSEGIGHSVHFCVENPFQINLVLLKFVHDGFFIQIFKMGMSKAMYRYFVPLVQCRKGFHIHSPDGYAVSFPKTGT